MESLKRIVIPILSVVLIAVVFSCGSTKESNPEELKRLYDLVESKDFTIKNEWLIPLQFSRKNIVGTNAYIDFDGDSVTVDLPYYGERYVLGDIGDDGGIQLEGLAENLEISKNENSININFEAEDGTETLDFSIDIYSENNVSTTVNSSHRSSISYEGYVEDTEATEE